MQFINLKKQYDLLKPEIDARLDQVFSHGQYIMGPEVMALEQTLAEYVNVRHCIGVANGTDALMIAMMALGIRPGDEIITPAFTFIATGETIALMGAKPVFVDIHPDTFNMDVNRLEAAITKKTKAIMPVSLFGQCPDLSLINDIAAHYGLPVIEDAAQSFGATTGGKKSCSMTTIACTSFFPSKPLGCYGDGGACFTEDDALALRMQQIRIHGQAKRYHHTLLGMNSRLDTLQAAILLAKMTVFEEEVAARARIGQRYHDLLSGHVKTMKIEPGNTCVYAQYTIQVENRDEVQQHLKSVGIPTAIHYPLPLHAQPVFTAMNLPPVYLPETEKAAKEVLSLPMHPYLTPEDQDRIVQHVAAALSVPA